MSEKKQERQIRMRASLLEIDVMKASQVVVKQNVFQGFQLHLYTAFGRGDQPCRFQLFHRTKSLFIHSRLYFEKQIGTGSLAMMMLS